MNDLGTAADHGKPAQSTKLVNSYETSNDAIVLDRNMARQCGYVGHDHIVTDHNIVCDVAIGKYLIVITYPSRLTIACGAIDGD